MPPNGKIETSPRLNKLVAMYLAIRKKKEQIEERHKKELVQIEAMKQKLTGTLMEILDRTGQESARTTEGTVSLSMRHTASLADPDAFMDYVMKNGAFELMDRRANSPACREFAEEHGSLPPGVKINSVRTLSVRSPQ